ncbi:hypothetical protein D3C87_124460 [compost metagenome]
MKIQNIIISLTAFISIQSFAAAPQYQVNMRVGMKGSAPLSINTPVKSGKKAFVTEISEDGLTETQVEVFARKSQVDNKAGLYMDVLVTKRVRGQMRFSERAQVFAPDNQEMEFGLGKKGKATGSLSLAVMAHQL